MSLHGIKVHQNPLKISTLYRRFPDNHFPGQTFPGQVSHKLHFVRLQYTRPTFLLLDATSRNGWSHAYNSWLIQVVFVGCFLCQRDNNNMFEILYV